LAIDEMSFGERQDIALYAFCRWGDEPRYRCTEGPGPRFPLVLGALGDARGIPTLDVSFAEGDFVDVTALLPAKELYELG